jgi:hypothetical protein
LVARAAVARVVAETEVAGRAQAARDAEVGVVWAQGRVRAVVVLGADAAVAAVTAPDYQEKAEEEVVVRREAGVRAAVAMAAVVMVREASAWVVEEARAPAMAGVEVAAATAAARPSAS